MPNHPDDLTRIVLPWDCDGCANWGKTLWTVKATRADHLCWHCSRILPTVEQIEAAFAKGLVDREWLGKRISMRKGRYL